MKNLKLQNLWLMSHVDKAARAVQFKQTTVITGDNDTGKSSLIKSIYATLGAPPAKTHPRWKKANVISLAEFSVDGEIYYALRDGGLYAVFDKKKQSIVATTHVTRMLGPFFADLLDFRLVLTDRQGFSITPPPAYCFLPFYVDQDKGWQQAWQSFDGLAQFANFRRNVTYYHSGIWPKEYYLAKGQLDRLRQEQEPILAERNVMIGALKRLKERRKAPTLALSAEAFKANIEQLLTQCTSLAQKQHDARTLLSELNSKRIGLVEEIELARAALAELDSDFKFIRRLDNPHVACPTCGTEHENSFINRFALMEDREACRGFLARANAELRELEKRIENAKDTVAALDNEFAEINKLLNEKKGAIRLQDIVDSESERQMDNVIGEAIGNADLKLAELEAQITASEKTVKSFEDVERRRQIEDFYATRMAAHLNELQVSTLSIEDVAQVDALIKETGSDLPRALLAYYFSFLESVKKYSTSCFCPIVIDSPIQQDQDPQNATKMIKFTLDHQPLSSQLILGTVKLHDVQYSGHRIELTNKHHLLNKDEYEPVRGLMAQFYDQLI